MCVVPPTANTIALSHSMEGSFVVAILDKILRAGEGRALKQLEKIAEEVNLHESTFSSMSDRSEEHTSELQSH